MRLRCEIFRNGKAVPGKVFDVLNEVVVDRGSNPYLSKIECYEHDRLITKVRFEISHRKRHFKSFFCCSLAFDGQNYLALWLTRTLLRTWFICSNSCLCFTLYLHIYICKFSCLLLCFLF